MTTYVLSPNYPPKDKTDVVVTASEEAMTSAL
jgi:hypothetical protein